MGYTGISLSVRPSPYLVYATPHLSFCRFFIIFGMMVGHDVRMRRLYQFDGWLNFASFGLYVENLVYATSHLSLADFVHIWHDGWAWCEHAHIIPISRLVVRVMALYAPNWVCSCPFTYLVHATLHSSLDGFCLYLNNAVVCHFRQPWVLIRKIWQ